MSFLIGIALVVAAAGAEMEGALHTSATLEPPVIPYHKQAGYTLTVETAEGTEVRFPEMHDKFSGLTMAGPPQRRVEPLGGKRVRLTESYTLDPIFAGDYLIAAAAIYSGDVYVATVPSVVLRVRDLTPEETAAAEHFEANAGPIDPPNPWLRSRMPWAVTGILATAACAAAYWYFRRPRAAAAPPPRPAWEVAYDRLRDLDSRHLPRSGQYEPYYVELSAVLRTYIEARFTLHAPERTTQEFLAEASSSGLMSDAHQKLLAGFLRHCDRVKFAQFQPTIDEMDRSLALALQFVDDTVPRPEPIAAEAAA